MTALGLAVAVPAVLGYNWVMRRNKAIAEQLGAFSSDFYGYMMSGGAVRPVSVGKPAAAAPKTPAVTATASPRACLSEWTREPSWSPRRSEEHTSELQSLLRSSSAVISLKKKNK